ncbi:MAG: AraC family transcriptional regulator [Bilifractor sp.]
MEQRKSVTNQVSCMGDGEPSGKAKTNISGHFVTMHYVNEEYHRNHPQLMHTHEDVLELLYISEGSGSYAVDRRLYPVQAGNLIICNQGVVHGEVLVSNHEMESYCCVMNQVHLPGLPENTITGPGIRPVLYYPENERAVFHLMQALYEISHGEEADTDVCGQLGQSLLELVCLRLRKEAGTGDRRNPRVDEIISEVVDYLDQHYRDLLTVTEMQERFHISRSYLSHLFKRETGMSMKQYILARRVGEAQNLLMNSCMSMGEICEDLGFGDNCHFSSTFRKIVGLSPTEYRNHFKGDDAV